MALNIAQFLARFTEEAREHVRTLNEGLLSLEKSPDDPEPLNAVFRSAHTLKGSSKMMKLTSISEVAHKMEEVLDGLRGKRLAFSKELSNLLFAGIDTISAMVEEAAAGAGTTADTRSVCEALDKAARGELHGTPVVAAATNKAPVVSEAPRSSGYESIRVSTIKLDELIKLAGEMSTVQGRLRQRIVEIRAIEKLAEKCVRASTRMGKQNGSSPGEKEVIDAVLAVHSGLSRLASTVEQETRQQERLSRELQGSSINLRMVPLSSLFESLHRTVRDLADSLGKKVNFVVEGGETELDKKMVEKLGDPLVHMIRNAVDHGIESPEERLKAGKEETGTIRLTARYEGEKALIELSDDGEGISMTKLKKTAICKNLLTEDQAGRLSEAEVANLIFHPGISTSGIITDVSGRGVGMDVVKRNVVEHLKGSIRIDTREGKGTTFSVSLLLTLAVMRVLIISVTDTKFAVPSSSVEEIVRAHEDDVIDVVNKKAIRLREQLVPVASLGQVLGVPRVVEDGCPGRLCLVCSTGRGKLGLMVDDVLDEEDVVVKPLPSHLQFARYVSGAIVWGANEVINVLNVNVVAEAARELKGEAHLARQEPRKARTINVLVVDDSVNTREIEKGVLEAYGYSVTLAADGIEALTKASETRYDAIVTDVEMPRMDGFAFTERMRQDATYRNTPIILVTSRDKEEDKKRGIKVGANAYIVKGAFDQTNLVETIRNLVG